MNKFPLYRKYTNNETYFKILSENEFEEIQKVGDKVLIYHIEAIQFPEKLRIKDMIDCREKIWIELSEEEYEQTKKLFLSGRA